MAITITVDQVRQRLITLTSDDVSDAILNSAALIPAANAWANRILSQNSTDADSLDEDQTALVIAAKIAYAARRVVTSAPEDEWSIGPIKDKSAPAKDKTALAEILDREATELLKDAGIVRRKLSFSKSGGDDFHPDGSDNTNVDISLADESRPFTMWPGS